MSQHVGNTLVRALLPTLFIALVTACGQNAPPEPQLSGPSGAGTGRGEGRGLFGVENGKVFRPVLGQPGRLCADLGQYYGTQTLYSLWYAEAQSPETARLYEGSCATYALSRNRAAYKDVPGTNLRCAELPGGQEHMEFVVGQGVRTAVRRPGNCVSLIPEPQRPRRITGYSDFRLMAGGILCADPGPGAEYPEYSIRFESLTRSIYLRNASCDFAEDYPEADATRETIHVTE